MCPDDSFDHIQAKLKTDRAEYIRENDGQASLEELFNMYHDYEEDEDE